VRLSPKEYELLVKLAEADGKVLTHKDLLISLWGPAHAQDMQYLRVFIGQLRQKIEPDPSAPRLVLTQPGIGYRFMADEAARPATG
jgi:two-component system KDP operon response regulator KdpE